MKWGREIVLSELVGESVGREVAKVLGPPFERLPKITAFPEPLQGATVSAGDTAQVYYEKIPIGCIGFVQFIGNLYYLGDELSFLIDGNHQMGSPHIERVIGDINAPLEIRPWMKLPVRDEIVWKAKNKDVAEHNYDVLCDGFYLPIEDLPLLLALTTPVR